MKHYNGKNWYTIVDLADHSGANKDSLWYYIKSNKLPYPAPSHQVTGIRKYYSEEEFKLQKKALMELVKNNK